MSFAESSVKLKHPAPGDESLQVFSALSGPPA
jgi:hypothetical protein